jgi:hypothetical protein
VVSKAELVQLVQLVEMVIKAQLEQPVKVVSKEVQA